MKLLLLSSHLTKYGHACKGDRLLLESARERSLETKITDPKNISYLLSEHELQIFDGDSEITDSDIVLIRRTRDAELESYQLAKTFEKKGRVVVDPSEALLYPTSKLIPQMSRLGTKYVPKSIFVSEFSESNFEELILKNLDFPMAIKPQNGVRKKGFKILRNEDEVIKHFREEKKCSVIFQPYFDIITKYRVLTIGRKPVGFFYMKGTSKRKGEKKAKEIAEEMAQDNPALILGIDIWRLKDKRYLVAECNRNPTFIQINKSTNKKYEQMIIDYCISIRTEK